MRGARAAARSVVCQQNLRSIFTATVGHRNDHDGLLPHAEFLIYLPTGDEDPMPAVGVYLDTETPYFDESVGRAVTFSPWLSPADHEWGMESGSSYSYVPASLMQFAGTREATRSFDAATEVPMWMCFLPYHGWRNYVTSSGAIGRKNPGEY